MKPNRRFKLVLTLEFDVREDDTLCEDNLYTYSANDWKGNYQLIVEDKGVSEFLPKPTKVTTTCEEI